MRPTTKRLALALGAGLTAAAIGAIGAGSPAPAGAGATPGRLPATCDPGDPETCRYVSDLDAEVGVVSGVSLHDPGRGDLEIPLVIRYPIVDAGEPRPVVVWNHGGAPSPRGANRSEEWGNLLAAAGYVVIHPARLALDDPSPSQAECAANGVVTPDECAFFMAEYIDGPLTARFVIQHLGDVAALDPALTGLLDPSRIVVAGHSAGSTTVLALAGAWQQWLPDGPRYEQRDDAPIAFLATGVQGPMYAGFGSGFQSADSDSGFDTHSFAGIDRPFMFVTGVGDETKEPPESRVSAWLTAQGTGGMYLSWDTVGHAVHETMDIHKCDTPVRADHCRWIGSAGLAFLDAVVRGRPAARQWLDSDAYRVLTGGAIELHRR